MESRTLFTHPPGGEPKKKARRSRSEISDNLKIATSFFVKKVPHSLSCVSGASVACQEARRGRKSVLAFVLFFFRLKTNQREQSNVLPPTFTVCIHVQYSRYECSWPATGGTHAPAIQLPCRGQHGAALFCCECSRESTPQVTVQLDCSRDVSILSLVTCAGTVRSLGRGVTGAFWGRGGVLEYWQAIDGVNLLTVFSAATTTPQLWIDHQENSNNNPAGGKRRDDAL